MSGSRGPLTRADSIRGERERRPKRGRGDGILNGEWNAPAASPKAAGKAPKCPPWLTDASQGTWRRVVTALRKAGVPLAQIDAEAIGFYVACIDGARDAAAKGDAKLVARFSRDAIAWGTLIGATPAARARMGIKPPRDTAPDDPWARLAARQ